jgi:putative oxidoreductase
MSQLNRQQHAVIAIRAAGAITMIVHGLSRAMHGVAPFGEYLGSMGFPLGLWLAWLLTVGELVGGALLLFGRGTRLLSLWFAVELLAGIAMVHGREGWFVVGAGRNGMEYSVVLIVMLLAVAWSAPERHEQ